MRLVFLDFRSDPRCAEYSTLPSALRVVRWWSTGRHDTGTREHYLLRKSVYLPAHEFPIRHRPPTHLPQYGHSNKLKNPVLFLVFEKAVLFHSTPGPLHLRNILHVQDVVWLPE